MKFKEFGINLAKIRGSAGMSAYELSLKIDKGASYIHKVENGKINISLKTILTICEVLEIEPVQLFQTDLE